MARLTKRLHESFALQLISIETTRNTMEELFYSGSLNMVDIEHVYAGLFMELFTNFEALLEELFFGIMEGTLYTRTYPILKKAIISPKNQIRHIVLGGKQYLNWLPYTDNTLIRAKLYILDGEPFCRLRASEVTKITSYHQIRNAIAHKSDNSMEKFNKSIANLTLLPRERTPTGYLRSKPYTGTQTQFEIAAIELKLLTNILCG